MQFDSKNKWYTGLISAPGVSSYLVGRNGSVENLLATPPLHATARVRMEQVHGAGVAVVDQRTTALETTIPAVDAVLTQLPGITLEVRVADCLPILLWHPLGVIGAVHAGRRGTQAGVLKQTLQRLSELVGNLDGLKVWLGPAICQAHYQIDKEQDLHYDLLGENLKQLAELTSGQQIEVSNTTLCTVCNNDQFYSYRKEATESRNYAFLLNHARE